MWFYSRRLNQNSLLHADPEVDVLARRFRHPRDHHHVALEHSVVHCDRVVRFDRLELALVGLDLAEELLLFVGREERVLRDQVVVGDVEDHALGLEDLHDELLRRVCSHRLESLSDRLVGWDVCDKDVSAMRVRGVDFDPLYRVQRALLLVFYQDLLRVVVDLPHLVFPSYLEYVLVSILVSRLLRLDLDIDLLVTSIGEHLLRRPDNGLDSLILICHRVWD